ncbi:PEP-CTERM sorting domain-containing protein [Planctomycetales bacterium ZRK34]|nr:PEP-CTERM sorting domain-containing protein [Planctomycetales bacterium ZRK34]
MRVRKWLWCAPMAGALLGAPVGAQDIGPSTSVEPYVVPTATGVVTQSLLTVGDTVQGLGGPYRLAGIPDGMGAYDNGDGTITVLMNHEHSSSAGVIRRHGINGSFVSKMIVDKTTRQIVQGEDLIEQVKLWDGAQYVTGSEALNRLCSADLPAATAFAYTDGSGAFFGTTDRIFMSGEETSNGRAFAHIATGAEAGTSYELPRLGNIAFENVLASPYAQQATLVAGMDDASRNFSSEGASTPSELYFYVGQKQTSGTTIEKAGLTNGELYGVTVSGAADENSFANGASFQMHNLGDVSDLSGAELQAQSIGGDVNNPTLTQFRRIEDGAWMTVAGRENEFYFVTTDTFNGNSKLWQVEFGDITDPTAGGTISTVVNGIDHGIHMMDNMTIDPWGRAIIQEDPGGNDYLASIWVVDLVNGGDPIKVAEHNPKFFDPAEADPAFLTNNEESSGIIPVFDLLGDGWYLLDVQAHYNIGDPELVEGGQFAAIYIPRDLTDVPEPASMLALAAGVMMIARRRKKA